MLQSELESCKELQELEPENKCEVQFPEILLLQGGPFLGAPWGEQGSSPEDGSRGGSKGDHPLPCHLPRVPAHHHLADAGAGPPAV